MCFVFTKYPCIAFCVHDFNFSVLYLRYVDDIIAIFRNGSDDTKVLPILNSQYKNIKFTVEHALNSNTIPFLDTKFEIMDTKFNSWDFRKKKHILDSVNFKH